MPPYMPPLPEPIKQAARLTVASCAVDAADLADLLGVLGLDAA